jgi:Putative MetA-pathway of phenol degradation
MLRKLVLGAGALALASTYPASAHHPSGSSSTNDAGPIATISATTLEKGQSVAGIVVEFIKLDPLPLDKLGGHPHPHNLDGIYSTSLVYAYGITSDLTLSLRLPFIRRTNIFDHHEGDLGDAAGVGDLSALAQYRFLNNPISQIESALLFGVRLPTGDTSVSAANGERFEAEFQPGSGSVDYHLGLAFTKRFGPWSFDTNVLYQFTNEGVQDTNLGDRFLYNAAISYRMLGFARSNGRMNAGLPEPMYHGGPKAKHHHHDEPAPVRGPALDLVLELNGEWHDNQRIGGVKDPNAGGNTVYLSPGLRLSVDEWSGFVSFGVPIISDLNGLQPEPEWRVLTGVAVSF